VSVRELRLHCTVLYITLHLLVLYCTVLLLYFWLFTLQYCCEGLRQDRARHGRGAFFFFLCTVMREF